VNPFRFARKEGIVQRLWDGGEIPVSLCLGRYRRRVGDRRELPQALISCEKERLVPLPVQAGDVHRAASDDSKLVPVERRPWNCVRVTEEEVLARKYFFDGLARTSNNQ
jgi:hypothetical protein